MLCQKSPTVESGLRLLEGRTEVTPSMAVRGYRMSVATGCWRTLWGEERLVAILTATPRSAVRSGAERIPISGRLHGQHTLSSPTTIWYAGFKVYSSTVVTTIVPRTTL